MEPKYRVVLRKLQRDLRPWRELRYSTKLLRLGVLAITSLLVFSIYPFASEADPQISPSVFSRELIKKVNHSLIGMTMMGLGNGIMSAGSGCSGVIFQSLPEENAAYALTNYHCVQSNVMFEVRLWDKTTYLARLVGSEPGIDTGIIRIENISPDSYEVCVLGDSDALVIGEPVIAMGGPGSGTGINSDRSDPMFGLLLHSTATMGVIMGKSTEAIDLVSWWQLGKRDLGTQQMMVNTPWRLYVQSAINGGNSGGPSFNSKGECIGLNHAGDGRGPTVNQNSNIAIPINFSKDFALQILGTGKYEVPWFGMDILLPPNFTEFQSVAEFEEKFYKPKVLKILGIRRNSPASESDLEVGDLILEFDGQVFPTITELRLYVFTLPIGKDVPVLVQRGKKKIDLTLTVGVKRGYNSELSF